MSKIIKPQIQTVSYYSLTDIVPLGWEGLYSALSSDAPFSWGDNDHTLVTSERFLGHLKDVVELHGYRDDAEIKQMIEEIEALGDVYIDLES